jgi:hypothetical protein
MANLKEEKRQKAKKLIELAFDNPDSEEGDNSAWRALRIIRKYKLLDTPPLDGILENETVRAVKNVADVVTNPEFVGNLKSLGQTLGGLAAAAKARRRR